jgi:Na+/H+ antiporter NhaB
MANGVLSAVSDNVFVATVYVDEVGQALLKNEIDRDTFDLLAVAINTGTNIPSVATPNSGSLPVPAHLGTGAIGAVILWAHGGHGFAVHYCDVDYRPDHDGHRARTCH